MQEEDLITGKKEKNQEEPTKKKRGISNELKKLTDTWESQKKNKADKPLTTIVEGKVAWVSKNKDIVAVQDKNILFYFNKGDVNYFVKGKEVSEGSTIKLEYHGSINPEETKFRKPGIVSVSTKRDDSLITIEPVNLQTGSTICPFSSKLIKESDTISPLKAEIMDETPTLTFNPFIEESKTEKFEKKDKSEMIVDSTGLPKTTLKVCTWNINHLSDSTEEIKAKTKKQALVSIFDTYNPDILVLQEINLYSPLAEGKSTLSSGSKVDYDWASGPLLKATNTTYTKKYGTQLEFYPIAFNPKKVELIEEMVILTHNTWDEVIPKSSFKSMTTVGIENKVVKGIAWYEHRPLVVAKFRTIETGIVFVIGIVHTSPSFHVKKSTWEYIRAMQARFKDIPWMLAGDWYVEGDMKIPNYPMLKKEVFSETLKGSKLNYVAPKDNTNYPKGHTERSGMVADFIITDECWKKSDKTEAELVRTDVITNESLLLNEVSDHSPVIAEFELDPNNKNNIL